MTSFDAESPDPSDLFLQGLVLQVLAFLATTAVFAVTVGLVVLLQRAGFDLFSLVWLGVVPLGAFLIGLFIAFAYYRVSLFLDIRPTPLAASFAVVLSVLAAGAIHYSNYLLWGGTPGDLPAFRHWLDQILRHMRFGVEIYGYQFGGAKGGPEMGLWGYAAAFFQVLALAAGGVLPLAFLWERPYCPWDRKFHRFVLRKVLAFGGEGREGEGLRGLEAGSRTYFERVQALPQGHTHELEWDLTRCPKCSREVLIERVFKAKQGVRSPWTVKHRFLPLGRGRSVESEIRSSRA